MGGLKKVPAEGGSGGGRGHSGMEHWATTAEIKDAARVVRRAADTEAIHEGISAMDDFPPLQPLATPAGWTVAHNDFRAVDPKPGFELMFREDLLQAVNPASGYIIDLGWYPEGDLAYGEYALYVVVRGEEWEAGTVHEFRTRNRARIVEEIERCMSHYARPNAAPAPAGSQRTRP